ncbi:hypothetical protein Tco_0264439 [Tanacetum coccineum]
MAKSLASHISSKGMSHLVAIRLELRNKHQVSSSGGSLIQNDAITALTKQVKALEYHIVSMRETYDQNQEASSQLMQNQMGQLEEAFQERPLGVLPSDTETYPREERKAVTTMSGLTLDGSFIPHSNFLVYQDEELEPETITGVVEIPSSQSTPLVPPLETPPLSAPKPKKNLKPNPHQLLIPYPSQLQEEKYQALENPTGLAIPLPLLIDPLPPDDRSDSHHEEFADELAHIITSPEYGSVRNHKKTVKNEQARTQESEEYKKKPKNQSRSQKIKPKIKRVGKQGKRLEGSKAAYK